MALPASGVKPTTLPHHLRSQSPASTSIANPKRERKMVRLLRSDETGPAKRPYQLCSSTGSGRDEGAPARQARNRDGQSNVPKRSSPLTSSEGSDPHRATARHIECAEALLLLYREPRIFGWQRVPSKLIRLHKHTARYLPAAAAMPRSVTEPPRIQLARALLGSRDLLPELQLDQGIFGFG
ncbi:hypothetical protein BDZ91DRAFT_145053 [Kalaharituber pfeilii]|nr:hypothetical protein BDZ91DRAFT_145053 [Kalaharituber pfeilii]